MMFWTFWCPVSPQASVRLFFASLFLLGAAAVLPVHAAKKEAPPPADKEVTITGVVAKAAVDENDKVIAVEIQEDRSGETEYYLVNDDTKGNELLGLVDKRVEVTGVVDEDEDDNKILTVKSYTVK